MHALARRRRWLWSAVGLEGHRGGDVATDELATGVHGDEALL